MAINKFFILILMINYSWAYDSPARLSYRNYAQDFLSATQFDFSKNRENTFNQTHRGHQITTLLFNQSLSYALTDDFLIGTQWGYQALGERQNNTTDSDQNQQATRQTGAIDPEYFASYRALSQNSSFINLDLVSTLKIAFEPQESPTPNNADGNVASGGVLFALKSQLTYLWTDWETDLSITIEHSFGRQGEYLIQNDRLDFRTNPQTNFLFYWQWQYQVKQSWFLTFGLSHHIKSEETRIVTLNSGIEAIERQGSIRSTQYKIGNKYAFNSRHALSCFLTYMSTNNYQFDGIDGLTTHSGMSGTGVNIEYLWQF